MSDKPMFDFVVLNPSYGEEMAIMTQAAMDNPVLMQLCSNAAAVLIQVSRMDKVMGEDREAFLSSKVEPHVKHLGEALNKAGQQLCPMLGIPPITLMRFVAEIAAPHFPGRSDLRLLEFAWDGIGEWRC